VSVRGVIRKSGCLPPESACAVQFAVLAPGAYSLACDLPVQGSSGLIFTATDVLRFMRRFGDRSVVAASSRSVPTGERSGGANVSDTPPVAQAPG
jgi:hypothetical protein